MTLLLAKIEHITFPEALVYSLIGFAVVFVVLVVLMVVIRALRSVMEMLEAKKPEDADEQSAPQDIHRDSAQTLIPAKGSVGEVNLFTVDDQTAAMIMAITADKAEYPLNELRFHYICEEGKGAPANKPSPLSTDVLRYKLMVNGKRYEVGLERCEPILLSAEETAVPIVAAPVAATPVAAEIPVSPPSGGAVRGNPVRSPLPGTILTLKVSEGEIVKAGQVLLILEAMKMENEIAAPHDGRVAQIFTSKGSNIETNAILLTLE